MKFLEWIFAPLAFLAIPLAILNLVGGIVAGIWLIILGEWTALLIGFAILFVGAWTASLMLAPGFGISALGITAMDHGNKFVGWLLLALAAPWAYIIVIVWQIAIFRWFGQYVDGGNAIPIWLWSYGAATGVWSFMASKEPEGSAAPITAFAAQIAYIVLSICVIQYEWPINDAIVAMCVPFTLPIIFGIAMTLEQSRRTY